MTKNNYSSLQSKKNLQPQAKPSIKLCGACRNTRIAGHGQIAGHQNYGYYGYRNRDRRYYRPYNNNTGEAVALGALAGLTTAAVVNSAANTNNPVVVNNPPYYSSYPYSYPYNYPYGYPNYSRYPNYPLY